jgi:hypothetical protein
VPKFEITDDAFRIVTGQAPPIAVPDGLPPVLPSVQGALDDAERYTRPGTLMVMRRVTAERAIAEALCEWFVKAEATLRQSPESIDQTRARMCGAAAKAIALAVPAR